MSTKEIESPELKSLIAVRHSLKSQDGLSPEGLELAKKVGKTQLAKIINQASPESLIIVMGVSDANRTRQTAESMIQGLALAIDKDEVVPDTLLITPDKLVDTDESQRGSNKYPAIIRTLNRLAAEEGRGKKVVISLPLEVTGLSLLGWMKAWKDEERKLQILHPYFLKLDNIEPDLDKQFFIWLREYVQARDAGEPFEGPNPEKVGQGIVSAVAKITDRVIKYASKQNQDRPLSVVVVSHSYIIDLLMLMQLNKGKLSVESVDLFEGEVAGRELIKEAEIAEFNFPSDGKRTLVYRDKIFEIGE